MTVMGRCANGHEAELGRLCPKCVMEKYLRLEEAAAEIVVLERRVAELEVQLSELRAERAEIIRSGVFVAKYAIALASRDAHGANPTHARAFIALWAPAEEAV